MGALSDGLLGAALGVGTTLSNEFDRMNEEDTLIRREGRADERLRGAEERANIESDRRSGRDEGLVIGREERLNLESDRRSERDVDVAIGKEGRAADEFDRKAGVTDQYAEIAHARALEAEGAKMRYASQLNLSGAADLNTQKVEQLEGGTDAAQISKQQDEARAQRLKSTDAGIEIRTKGTVTEENLRLKREDAQIRKDEGLPQVGGVTVGLKSLSPSEVKSTVNDVIKRELGENVDKYEEQLKKDDAKSLAKTLKGGGEDSRELVSTILNGTQGEGQYWNKDPIEMLHKEIAHITTSSLRSKSMHRAKDKGQTVQGPILEEATRDAIQVATSIEEVMIEGWTQADSPGFVSKLAAETGKSEKEAKAFMIDLAQKDLQDAMGLTAKEAAKSVPYSKIWNIYKRPLMDLLNGNMAGGMIPRDEK
jgi:hypothetical protein